MPGCQCWCPNYLQAAEGARLLYPVQKENGFYLNNFWEIERTYPKIKKAWQRISNTMLLQLSKRITANIASGNIKKEESPGVYDLLANSLLLCINYRIPQQILRSKPTQERLFKSFLWNLLQPYFTSRGKAEFKKTAHSWFFCQLLYCLLKILFRKNFLNCILFLL